MTADGWLWPVVAGGAADGGSWLLAGGATEGTTAEGWVSPVVASGVANGCVATDSGEGGARTSGGDAGGRTSPGRPFAFGGGEGPCEFDMYAYVAQHNAAAASSLRPCRRLGITRATGRATGSLDFQREDTSNHQQIHSYLVVL
jgi:hypothetical protein